MFGVIVVSLQNINNTCMFVYLCFYAKKHDRPLHYIGTLQKGVKIVQKRKQKNLN